MHLAGNLYFLLVFGSNVEDCLGKWRFFALILLATLAGDVLHVLAQPSSIVSCIGASGGISGLIAYYVLKFPHARLDFLVHCVAFSDKEELKGRYVETTRKNFTMTMDISCFSFTAVCQHRGGLRPEPLRVGQGGDRRIINPGQVTDLIPDRPSLRGRGPLPVRGLQPGQHPVCVPALRGQIGPQRGPRGSVHQRPFPVPPGHP
jgi:hypothetical protein